MTLEKVEVVRAPSGLAKIKCLHNKACSIRRFPEIRVTFLGSLFIRIIVFLRSMLRSPCFGKLPYEAKQSAGVSAWAYSRMKAKRKPNLAHGQMAATRLKVGNLDDLLM